MDVFMLKYTTSNVNNKEEIIMSGSKINTSKKYEEVFTTSVGLKGYVWFNERYGFYCGYVEGKGISEDIAESFDVHGGVTYVDDNLIGFDCGHISDLTSYNVKNKSTDIWHTYDATFKDKEFVKKEIEFLAKQVHKHINLQDSALE